MITTTINVKIAIRIFNLTADGMSLKYATTCIIGTVQFVLSLVFFFFFDTTYLH